MMIRWDNKFLINEKTHNLKIYKNLKHKNQFLNFIEFLNFRNQKRYKNWFLLFSHYYILLKLYLFQWKNKITLNKIITNRKNHKKNNKCMINNLYLKQAKISKSLNLLKV